MFLNLLNDEEKVIFLKLAISVIQADGKLEESEKSFIAEYSREMGIERYTLGEKVDPMPLAEKIGKNSTDSVKRIFLVELLACANADGDFAEYEKSLIRSFVKIFGLSESSLQDSLDLLNEYTKISAKLMNFIQEGK
ncbi:TerB family tellurite resistance protein [Treponema putidum]|uniref:TerB family tellurite resistance protein n=1 Tax=Treponema putidum TaxID=221027 RepID=A0AAE9MV00_9SPIR|nr:TerB family tellurite resistance protein [Treponema putidum]UTY33281.1 TerB family tellurite resistance protein [Treponema putidum]